MKILLSFLLVALFSFTIVSAYSGTGGVMYFRSGSFGPNYMQNFKVIGTNNYSFECTSNTCYNNIVVKKVLVNSTETIRLGYINIYTMYNKNNILLMVQPYFIKDTFMISIDNKNKDIYKKEFVNSHWTSWHLINSTDILVNSSIQIDLR